MVRQLLESYLRLVNSYQDRSSGGQSWHRRRTGQRDSRYRQRQQTDCTCLNEKS